MPVQATTMEQNPWLIDVMQQVEHHDTNQESRTWKTQCIYRIPDSFTHSFINSPTDTYYSYIPQMVSFGPFHHGQLHLKPMEQHKVRALVHFLKAAKKPVQVFLEALAEVEQQLKDCYEQLEENWSSEHGLGFLDMMLLDGCFMLEILRTAAGGGLRAGYAHNDPVFSLHGELYALPFIKHDMLLLENQIPLLVLEKLIAAETGKAMDYKLINKLVLGLWRRESFADDNRHVHVLDAFRDSLVRKIEPRLSVVPIKTTSVEPIALATELDAAGVKFKKSNTDSLQDITFSNGVLYLPVIRVDDSTGPMLLNLMAFERSHEGAGSFVTSYVVFMDHLLDTSQDVSLLQAEGIIENYYGGNEAVAGLFSFMSVYMMTDPRSEINIIRTKLNKYCRRKRNVWRANLVRTYCSNPWTVLSLLGAIFLLVLTVLQTVYTMLGFY